MPTAAVAIPECLRTASEKGTWYPGPVGIFTPGISPPDEQSTRSTPLAFTISARAMESSVFQPFSIQSLADMRTNKGYLSGQLDRTAATTSSKKRIRFSKLPPYLSLRWLDRGDRNSLIRYPCAACISITLKPALNARAAALLKSAIIFSIPFSSKPEGWSLSGENGMGLGARVFQPPWSGGISLFPSQGAVWLAFLPACASCIPAIDPC